MVESMIEVAVLALQLRSYCAMQLQSYCAMLYTGHTLAVAEGWD